MQQRALRRSFRNIHKGASLAFRAVVACTCLWLSTSTYADTVVDWGPVITPLTTEASFSFAQFDRTANFTDSYHFSLEGAADATYSVTFAFDLCRNGCGSPELAYGIYDNNGGLIAGAENAATLSSGNYVFQVKGTGLGSGNSIDYWGSVTFAATAIAMVSPAPEPATWLLTLTGLGGVGGVAWRRRSRTCRADSSAGKSATLGTPAKECVQ